VREAHGAYSSITLEKIMGILDKLEEVAGAVVAVEGLKKVDANASILSEAAAAVAGYKGAELLKEKLESKDQPNAPEQPVP
jgi:hypothetical protein